MHTNATAMKAYKLYYTLSRLNITYHLSSSSSAETANYYGESHWAGFVTGRPQLILRLGDAKTSPIIAAAKLNKTSKDIQLCLGDYENDDEGKVVWEDMRRDKTRLLRGDYTISTSLGSVDGVRRTYNWRRDAEKAVRTVYNCVNDKGEVMARMASGGMLNWKKAGEIDVAEGLEDAMETLLLVGASGIFFAEAGWSFGRGYEKGSTSTGGEQGVDNQGKTT